MITKNCVLSEITKEKIALAVKILQKNNDNPWEGSEGKWAIMWTEREIRLVRLCLELGLYNFRASCETSINDRESIQKIIKELGEIA